MCSTAPPVINDALCAARSNSTCAGRFSAGALSSILISELAGRLMALCLVDEFFDLATRANENLPGRVAPARQRRRREHGLFLFRFTLSQKPCALRRRSVILPKILLSAAMLADPAVAVVNEVGCF